MMSRMSMKEACSVRDPTPQPCYLLSSRWRPRRICREWNISVSNASSAESCRGSVPPRGRKWVCWFLRVGSRSYCMFVLPQDSVPSLNSQGQRPPPPLSLSPQPTLLYPPYASSRLQNFLKLQQLNKIAGPFPSLTTRPPSHSLANTNSHKNPPLRIPNHPTPCPYPTQHKLPPPIHQVIPTSPKPHPTLIPRNNRTPHLKTEPKTIPPPKTLIQVHCDYTIPLYLDHFPIQHRKTVNKHMHIFETGGYYR